MHTILPAINRRLFLATAGHALGSAALTSLLTRDGKLHAGEAVRRPVPGVLAEPHHAPKAKRIISLFMAGGPAQQDLFDYKPTLIAKNGEELPESVRGTQRLTGMSASQARLPVAGTQFRFQQHGQSGAWVSELLPFTAKMTDDLCFVKSCHTDAINHDPAITLWQSGHQLPGRPSFGSWLSYGLGAETDDLPAFVVLISKDRTEQGLYARLWGNAFLPSQHQGVQFRSGKDPVLYLANPPGVSVEARRGLLDRFADLHAAHPHAATDPDLTDRVGQYEMAYRMQASVPKVMDFSDEPASTFDLYGPEAKTPGTFAANCLLARRLAERGVRFVQLYHPGWDQHLTLPKQLVGQCKDTDRGGWALVQDLKRRGLLDDTLVVWGGEFGRTSYSQGKLTVGDYGRDHHPGCYTTWLAGGGIKPGISYGATDDWGYNVTENPVHVHDLQATILHLLGINHTRLTYKFQGRHYRLTDVHGSVVNGILV